MKKMHKKINFDVCTFCNHQCTFCSNPDKRTKKAITSFADFKRAMDNVMRYVSTNEMGLSAKGEVLLNKDLESIIAHCKQAYKIPYVYISSNGALLDAKRAQSLLESGIDSIKFSINAVDETSYAQTHSKNDFQKVIQNFKHLIHLKKTAFPNLKLLISSVLTPLNAANPKAHFERIFGKDFLYIDAILPYTRAMTQKEYAYNVIGGGHTTNNPTLNPTTTKASTKSNFTATKQPINQKPLCHIPFDEIWINSDCSLILCCKDYFDTINFGSLLKYDFLELYHSKDFQSLRDMHISGNFSGQHLCRFCLGLN